MASQTSQPLIVLVVGASSGIGEATAKAFAARGHKVYGTSRDRKRVKLGNVDALSLDVFDETSMIKAAERVIEIEGRIDGMVYSAGFYCAGGVEETPLKDVEDQFQAYFFGAVRMAQIVLPYMREQKFGRLMFMSSTAGAIAIPFHAAYSASKGALGRWTEALAYELKAFNIQASYVEAGAINTNAPDAMRPPQLPMAEYHERRENAELAFKAALAKGLPPSAIGDAIVAAFESPKPRVRYRVGKEGKVFPVLRALLGETLFRGLISKSFKI